MRHNFQCPECQEVEVRGRIQVPQEAQHEVTELFSYNKVSQPSNVQICKPSKNTHFLHWDPYSIFVNFSLSSSLEVS
jgi:hypothetical protein